MQLDTPKASEEAFETALSLDPKLTEARVGLGMALLQQNRIDASIAQLEQAHRDAPKAPFTMGLLTQAYLSKGDTAAAEKMFSTLKESYPELALKMETTIIGQGGNPINRTH